MDIEGLAAKEQRSRKYAETFFEEEWEMEGIFKADIRILDSILTKKGKLIDVAMGPGRHVKYFAEKGFEVWGNDFSKHMIKAAKKHVKNKKVKFLNNDMSTISVKNNYFDYVICMGASLGSVYKRKERQKALNEFARIAKKGGYIIVHAHNLIELTEFEDIINLAKIVKNRLLHPNKFELGDVVYYHSRILRKAYMHWFMPGELRSLMKKAGLKIVQEFYLKGPDQEKIISNSVLKYLHSGGFVFIGRKI